MKDGYYVTLGIGIPTLVSDFIPQDVEVVLHSENGILKYGAIVYDPQEMDPELVNAGAQPVSLLPGGCFFHQADSFAMIRGGHIDICVLGGLQVSEKGDLANWMIPERKVGSIGGSMDLAMGAKKVIVAMEHTSPSGEPRIVKKCSYPLTGKGVVNTIVTNLAFIEVTTEGLLLREIASGLTPEEVQEVTEAKLTLATDLKEMQL